MKKNVSSYFRLGNCSFMDGRIDDAIRFYNLAIDERPRVFLYYENLGRALLQSEANQDEAEIAFLKAAKLNNNAVFSMYYLGKSYIQKKDHANAIYWLARAAATDKSSVIMERLGMAYYEAGNEEDAFEAFKEARRTSSLSAESFAKRLKEKSKIDSEALLKQITEDEVNCDKSVYRESERHLVEMVKPESSVIQACIEEGDMLMRQEQWDKAKKQFESGIDALLFSSRHNQQQ